MMWIHGYNLLNGNFSKVAFLWVFLNRRGWCRGQEGRRLWQWTVSISNFCNRKTDQSLPIDSTSTWGKVEQTVFAHSSSEGEVWITHTAIALLPCSLVVDSRPFSITSYEFMQIGNYIRRDVPTSFTNAAFILTSVWAKGLL